MRRQRRRRQAEMELDNLEELYEAMLSIEDTPLPRMYVDADRQDLMPILEKGGKNSWRRILGRIH